MNADQQKQIDAMRAALRTIAQCSGKIWGHLNERGSRFDRHQGENFGLDPCQEAQAIVQSAEQTFSDAELIVQAAGEARDAANQYLQSSIITANTVCGL